VAAQDRKSLARALHGSGRYWRYKVYPHTQNSEPNNHFKKCRRQFSTKIAFGMKINEAQGQTLKRVPIYPSLPVAFSRSSSLTMSLL
jgi:hypothetical protein